MIEAKGVKDKTARGLIWGGFNNVAQQLLNLVIGVWLGRILNVDDYGTIGVLTIFSLLATTLQESGFTQAIANKTNPTHKDFNAIFWCSSIIGVSLYILLYFLAPTLAHFFNNPSLVPLARFLFLGFVLASFGTVHNAYLFKYMMVKQRSISMLTGLVCAGIVGVTLAYNGYAYWGLAAQHITYIACTNLLFCYFTKWKPSFNISFTPIKEMFSFSYKILITKLCIHLNNHMFNIILGRLFNKKEVGFFTQANKWNLMGSSVISEMIQGVAQPLFKNISYDKDEQKKVFLKMISFTSFIAFPALLGLGYIAPEFITVLLTEKWIGSAMLLRILCVGGAFLPLNNLMSNLIISSGKSQVYMWNTIAMVACQFIAAISLYPYGIDYMIASFSFIQVSWLFVWFLSVRKEIQLSIVELIRNILPYVLLATLSVVLASFMLSSVDNIYLLLALKIFVVSALYILFLFLGKFTILSEVIYHVKRIVLKK